MTTEAMDWSMATLQESRGDKFGSGNPARKPHEQQGHQCCHLAFMNARLHKFGIRKNIWHFQIQLAYTQNWHIIGIRLKVGIPLAFLIGLAHLTYFGILDKIWRFSSHSYKIEHKVAYLARLVGITSVFERN